MAGNPVGRESPLLSVIFHGIVESSSPTRQPPTHHSWAAYETWKWDATGNGMASVLSVRNNLAFKNPAALRGIELSATYHNHRASSEAQGCEKQTGRAGHRSKGYSFEDLCQKHSILGSTRSRGLRARQKSHKAYQALTPAMESALEKYGYSGLPSKTGNIQRLWQKSWCKRKEASYLATRISQPISCILHHPGPPACICRYTGPSTVEN